MGMIYTVIGFLLLALLILAASPSKAETIRSLLRGLGR